jgi:DMSO/TMAO reductase YedYZ molybdopterin-dependent catalytic subunit
MGRRAATRALLAGGGAGLILTATMLLLRLWLDAPAFPERIADQVLLLVPQTLFSLILDRFGFSAKPLLFIATIAAQIIAASIGGLIYGVVAVALTGWRDLTNPLIGGAVGLLAGIAIDFALLPALGAGFPIDAAGGANPVAVLALAGLPGLTYGLTLAALLRLASPPRGRRAAQSNTARPLTRRMVFAIIIPFSGLFLTGAAFRRLMSGPAVPSSTGNRSALLPTSMLPTTAAAALTTAPTTMAAIATPAAVPNSTVAVVTSPSPAAGAITGGLVPSTPTRLVTPGAPTAPSATATAGITPTQIPAPTPSGPVIPSGVAPLITPTEQFYLVSKNLLDPTLKGEAWQLTIADLVGQPQRLRLPDLLALPPVRLAATLECISNEPGGVLIGNTFWTGVPLRTLLDSAAIQSGATHVVFTCADDYVERLTLAQALDPATVLVYAMNDAPLSPKHGFPARLIAAGRYGMKHPKWLTRIELVNGTVPSYWSQRGWNPDAPVQVFTRIDTPLLAVPASPVRVGGVAFAGDRGISRVELSADDGATWQPAQLEPALSPLTWVRWVATWTPPAPGTYTLAARAFEADGTPQEAETRTLNARGSTGYGHREVTVTP